MDWKQKLNSGLASIKGEIKKAQDKSKYSSAANKQILKKQEAEYFRAKETESLKFAREKAKLEMARKLKSLKEGKKDSNLGFGGLSFNPNASLLYGSKRK
jgi:hypothetical protein